MERLFTKHACPIWLSTRERLCNPIIFFKSSPCVEHSDVIRMLTSPKYAGFGSTVRHDTVFNSNVAHQLELSFSVGFFFTVFIFTFRIVRHFLLELSGNLYTNLPAVYTLNVNTLFMAFRIVSW